MARSLGLRLGPWYDGSMKHEIELPADVDRRLAERAAETGHDVEHLIQAAIFEFVDAKASHVSNGQWSDELQSRRSELIDKDIAGAIGESERSELARLDRLANEHFDRVAPPPFEGARRLHERLFKSRARRE